MTARLIQLHRPRKPTTKEVTDLYATFWTAFMAATGNPTLAGFDALAKAAEEWGRAYQRWSAR